MKIHVLIYVLRILDAYEKEKIIKEACYYIYVVFIEGF
jgi:hypothetical protein